MDHDRDSQAAEEAVFIQRLLDGDTEAFAELLDLHHDGMCRVAAIFVGNESAAEEVVQDTWMAVIEGLQAFERRSALKTWLFKILVNKAKTRAKRDGRVISFDPSEEIHEIIGDPTPGRGEFNWLGRWVSGPLWWDDGEPERLVSGAETRGLIEQAIAALPPAQRSVITLRAIRGWTAKEVCNILDVSETNQRVLLHRARAAVRVALQGIIERHRR